MWVYGLVYKCKYTLDKVWESKSVWHPLYFANPQIDLDTVKDMYLEKYDVTLKDALDSECGGDFKRLLIEILH